VAETAAPTYRDLWFFFHGGVNFAPMHVVAFPPTPSLDGRTTWLLNIFSISDFS